MSDSDKHPLTRETWAAVVHQVLSDHPDWINTTVTAVTSGVAEAIDRQKDRALTLSLGLMEAVGNPLRGKRRNHDRIISAIEVSQFHPTKWSEAAIQGEQNNRDRKQEKCLDPENPSPSAGPRSTPTDSAPTSII